jgi:cell division protein FtsI/penicillin-binding protein 2
MTASEKTHNFDNKRMRILCVLLLLWSLAIVFKITLLITVQRDKILLEGEKFAGVEGVLPAARGAIIDTCGKRLAWSEFKYDLVYSGRKDSTITPQNFKKLTDLFPEMQKYSADILSLQDPVRADLSAEELAAVESLVKTSGGEFQVRMSEVRRCVDDPEVRKLVGVCEVRDGRLTAVSGYELMYDKTLAGTDGAFRIRRDRLRRWIPSSWQLVKAPHPGSDVVVDLGGGTMKSGGENAE